MPIYEYEPDDRDCAMCEGRVEVIQGIDEPPYQYCPWCGLGVRRIISRASIQIKKNVDPESAAKRGFSTFRKLEKGKWEKVAGPDDSPSEPPPAGGELRIDPED